MLRHELPSGARPRLLEESDADELYALTDRNRVHLEPWLPHAVDWANRSTTIGYWLSAAEQGRGTITEAVRALVDHAFAGWQLERVVIEAAVGNARSRAVPERLCFRAEGVRRRAGLVGDRCLDLVVYSMLAADWRDGR